MSIGQRIQKFGFKRWYERTLIEGHAYLVTSFFGLILAFAGIELLGDAASVFLGFLLGMTGAGIVMFATPRYLRMLALAQALGGRAHCPRCNVYAAFNVIASGPSHPTPSDEPGEAESVWLRVQCRKCDNEWRM